MPDDILNNETTKLVIYGLGIGTLLFFAYLIYKDFRHDYRQYSQPLERQRKYGFMDENTGLEQIEQKLLQLEVKVDNFSKSNSSIVNSSLNTNTPSPVKSLDSHTEKPERKVVSMSPKIIPNTLDMSIKKNRAEYFGML